MSQEKQPIYTTSEIGGIRAPNNFQAIDATYYNLTDTGGRPIAGLMVLLDRLHRPVSAELHVYDDVNELARDNALRQSQVLLQERYYSRQAVPLRLLEVRQERRSMEVTLPTTPVGGSGTDKPKNGLPWQRIAAVAGGVLLVLALLWGLTRLWGGRSGTEDVGTDASIALTADGTADAAPADTATGAGAESAAVDETFIDPGADLPTSVNARSDLAVGTRIQIRPGLQAYLLPSPDTGAEESVGFIQDGQVATILRGPVQRRGESDTIVWWYVITETGDEGWAPANTSKLTLLEPVE